jgi:hypothetical protein
MDHTAAYKQRARKPLKQKKKQGKNPASFALAQNKVRTIVPTFFEIN